jgi:site-specific DNA-methyltransferase (adenine-specific)
MSLTITNEDNMDLMARYPDNYFDLAIVDPPYGINASNGVAKSQKKLITDGKIKGGNWDTTIPTPEYFTHLFRVSKNQIIWGGNYFKLPVSKGWIFWDKKQFGRCLNRGEMAWTSFSKMNIFERSWQLDRNWQLPGGKIHPTQKPVDLYKWLIINYASSGHKILDTHLGSGSIAIACYDLGLDLTACELDKDYYKAAMKRISEHQKKIQIDLSPKINEQWQQGGLF